MGLRLGIPLALVFLLGCSVTAKLYPVQTNSTIHQSTPSQPLIAKMEFFGLGKSGTISIVLANGETCRGPYSFVEQYPKVLDRNILSSAWDSVYGPGYFVAHVLGTNHAITELTGDQGSKVLIDFYRTPGETHNSQILGVASENKTGLYKVVF